MRELGFYITAPHLDSKRKNITIQEFRPFPWDSIQVAKPTQTKAQKAAMFKKWDNVEFKKQ